MSENLDRKALLEVALAYNVPISYDWGVERIKWALTAAGVPGSAAGGGGGGSTATSTSGLQTAGNTILSDILLELRDDKALSETIWRDSSDGKFYIRQTLIDQDSGTLTIVWKNPDGTVASPVPTVANLSYAISNKDMEVSEVIFRATVAGTGYAVGDILLMVLLIDTSSTASSISVWYNATNRTMLSVTPVATNLSREGGDATSALQTSGNTSLSSLDTKTPTVGQKTAALSRPVVLASDQTLALPTGASTETTLAAVKAKTDNLDVALSTRLKPADTLAAVTAITNTVTVKADTAVNQTSAFKVDGSAVTQPVSATALPLPTGASTETTLAAVKGKTDNLDVLLSTRLKPADTLAAVTTVATVSAVTAITNALPAGTNLLGKVGIDQTTDGTTNKVAANLYVGGAVYALGAKTTATSLGFNLASDQIPNVLAQAWFSKISDGTNTAAVKGASTTPLATDPALVTTLSPNSVLPAYRAAGTLTSSTITAGGTAQPALAANPSRRYLLIQNNSSADLWVNWAATAAVGTGLKVASGGSYENPPHFAPTGAISIIGATTGQAYTVGEA